MVDSVAYFNTERGYGFDGDKANLIAGTVPPGTSGDSTTVPRGSIYIDFGTDPAGVYYKKLTGSGTDKWKKLASLDDLQTEISWREPVVAHDDVTLVIPSGLGATDTRDNVTINDGDRVLFSATTNTAHRNVWIFTAESAPAAGDGFYTEDQNAESQGDRLYVYDGDPSPGGRKTYAGTIWTYNKNSVWVLSEKATDTTELGYIRQFIGKTDVGDLSTTEPNYTSTNHVADLTSLVAAISALDLQLGAELSGLVYVTDNADIATAIGELDAAIQDVNYQDSDDGVSGGAVVLDEVPTAIYAEAEWIVYVRDGNDIKSWTVTAIHDGTPTVNATNTDRANRVRLELGSPNDDWRVRVDTDAVANPGQSMRLLLDTDGDTVDWKILRRAILH